MKNIIFLIPDAVLKPTSLFSAIEVFEMANQFLKNISGNDFYNIKIGGINASQDLHNSHLEIKIDNIKRSYKPDLIIIPGISQQSNCNTNENKTLIKWVVKQYKEGAEVASLCTGTFLLAATGLLKNIECTTHWKAEEPFRAMFPNIKLCSDNIITDSNGVYTAGGATSSLNLILYLIEKYNGREAAMYCAKILQIDIDRKSQSVFILFEGQKNHPDNEIKKIQEFIESNINNKISIESLSSKFNISKRSLIRRFKKATNNLPNEYIQRVKIEVAKRDLEIGRKNVNEIMYSVGYSDVKAFRNIFKKVAGLTPKEYKMKFSNLN